MYPVMPLWAGCFGGILALNDTEYWPNYNEIVFFGVLLPPLVYCAGALVDKEHFFANLMGILMRCIVNAFISVATIALGTAYLLPKLGVDSLGVSDYLAIGITFISNDIIFALPACEYPEHEVYDEFSLVFGEAAFGIASSIALLKIIKDVDLSSRVINSSVTFYVLGYFGFVLFASSLLGLSIGWLISFGGWFAKLIVSQWERLKADPSHSQGVPDKHLRGATILLLYLTVPIFFLAEFLNLSGTLSVFFYGIVTTHYLWPKVTEDKKTWKDDIHGVNSIFKGFLSMWVGFSAVRMGQWSFMGDQAWTFLGVSAVLCSFLLLGRMISVYNLSLWGLRKTENIEQTYNTLLLNRWGISDIDLETQVTIWVSALLPGAVTYGLAYHQFGKSDNPHHALVLTCIIAVQLFTGLVLICWIKGLAFTVCNRVLVKQSSHSSTTMTKDAQEYVMISMEK